MELSGRSIEYAVPCQELAKHWFLREVADSFRKALQGELARDPEQTFVPDL